MESSGRSRFPHNSRAATSIALLDAALNRRCKAGPGLNDKLCLDTRGLLRQGCKIKRKAKKLEGKRSQVKRTRQDRMTNEGRSQQLRGTLLV